MRATNILWSVDDDTELEFLPDEIEIPNTIDEDDIADYISDVTGYCHEGYILEA